MIKVFIVRPFGTRTVLKKDKNSATPIPVSYDFDKVETELIKPAMEDLKLGGGTTGEVFESGDIREDMFSSLLLNDLVIADITVHNANVFYELGIRHALRDQKTILIKCQGYDETPFDIIGYKYITYDKDKPGDALPALCKFITDTLADSRKDSPVFNVLPRLEAQDPEKYLAMPQDFITEVKVAIGAKWLGKLDLLASEAESFSWKRPAFRLIGEALYQAKANRMAQRLWEEILDTRPVDREANDRLATIYQRLAEEEKRTGSDEGDALLTKSDLAIQNLLDNNTTLTNYQRAEAFALKARNAKTRWIYSWKDLPDGKQRAALRSVDLEKAYDLYQQGFQQDLNHYYAGINALGLLLVQIALANADPKTWLLLHPPAATANFLQEQLKAQYSTLSQVVQLSTTNAQARAANAPEPDLWPDITAADYTCLTAEDPESVILAYEQALTHASDLNKEAVVRQLMLYAALGISAANVKAAIDSIKYQAAQPTHTLLFTGHMIDKKDRTPPRFPESKVDAVRTQIREAILKEKVRLGPDIQLIGIAGGACGGDILFHEICQELGIVTKMFLALPRDKFVVESVAFAGPDWIDRFNSLYKSFPHPVLNDDKELPKWLQKKPDYSIWTRNNLWELHSALVNGGANMTLFALWDGKGGDGPGGTADMVKEAGKKGAKVIVLPI